MKDLIGLALQRIDDALLERTIKRLQREYLREMCNGRVILAGAIYRELEHAVKSRSEAEWARRAKRFERSLDPHALSVYRRATRG